MPRHSAVAATVTTLLFCLAAAAIMVTQLFKHPIVGIADNTDFHRISAQVGILPPGSYPEGYFRYAHLRFPFGQPEHIEYASTELLFCKIARTINRAIYSKNVFDIRFLGFVHACAYSIALFLFAYGIRLRPIPKFVFLALILFVLLDDRIVSYFNSFYSESAAVIFLVLTVGSMLTFCAVNPTRTGTWTKLLAFLTCSLLLAFSKSQHLVMLLPLWCFGICIAWKYMGASVDRYGWVLVSVLLMLGGMWFGIASRTYAATKGTNIKIVLANEIKPHSPDFAQDMRQLYATKDGISRVTLGRIALFYARHPNRYLKLMERRAAKAFQHIGYGSYTEVESKCPWEQSSKFNMGWHFKATYYPKHLWFILSVLVIGALCGAYNYFKTLDRWQSHIGLVTATLSIMAFGAYVIAATYEANGPEKHLFLFNVLFDLVTVFSLLLATGSFKSLRAIHFFNH